MGIRVDDTSAKTGVQDLPNRIDYGSGAQGVYTQKRVAESVKEWNELVVAIQIDLKKAFDRIRHETVTDTMRKKSVPG